eukprot:SAG31_NODE_15471_length_753_cov_1.316514_1_plen_149_part_00
MITRSKAWPGDRKRSECMRRSRVRAFTASILRPAALPVPLLRRVDAMRGLVSGALVLGVLAAPLAAAADMELLRQRTVGTLLPTTSTITRASQAARSAQKSMAANGSWPDIDYAVRCFGPQFWDSSFPVVSILLESLLSIRDGAAHWP